MTSSTSPYDWVKEVKPEIKQLDTTPLTGHAPPFAWDELSQRLSVSFERSLKIEPGSIQWRSKEQLLEGLGDNPYVLTLTVPTLSGELYWVMPEQEIRALESFLLTKDPHPLSFQDPELSQSFYRFFALEVLYNISQSSFDKTLVPLLTSRTTLPEDNALSWDIALHVQNQILWGRLLLSPDFRQSWVEHFSSNRSSLSEKLTQAINVLVHIEAGSTQLSLKQWQDIQLGDLLVLDRCTLTDENFEGRVILTVNQKQAFRAKIKDGNIKILEFPLYQEVEAPMPNRDENDEDELPDFDDLDEDFDLDEEEVEEEEEEEELEAPAEPRPGRAGEGTKAPYKEAAPVTQPTSKVLSPEEIPVTVTVEIGRLQMAVQKLLQLEPGNLLELDIHPEDGVNLTIQGKVIGKGELIRIGETLGVRILELG